MNITETFTEARLNAAAAGVLIQDDEAQYRLFGGLAAVFAVTTVYTTYRILRGLVKLAR